METFYEKIKKFQRARMCSTYTFMLSFFCADPVKLDKAGSNLNGPHLETAVSEFG